MAEMYKKNCVTLSAPYLFFILNNFFEVEILTLLSIQRFGNTFNWHFSPLIESFMVQMGVLLGCLLL
jgi:hypothetical protein